MTIRYYKPDGTFTDRGPLSLAANATHLVVLWDTTYGPPGNPTDLWVGAVGLIAGQPLVAVANQEREDILTHQSYDSTAGGGTVLHGPLLPTTMPAEASLTSVAAKYKTWEASRRA